MEINYPDWLKGVLEKINPKNGLQFSNIRSLDLDKEKKCYLTKLFKDNNIFRLLLNGEKIIRELAS